MSDDDSIRHEPLGLPGSEIVKNFGDEVRKAFDDAIGDVEARIAAAVKATQDKDRSWFAWASAGTIVGAALVVAGLIWLMHPPGRSVTEMKVHHADGLVETCVLAPDTPEAEPSFICHLP